MKIIIIAAVGKNNEIGYNNELLWHFKGDMKFFKSKTLNHIVVMGYKTFLSLPRPLVDRTNIVLTRQKRELGNDIIIYNNIADLINDYENTDEDLFIIGGASIYKLFIHLADEMYLTHINDTKEADVYFPTFDKNNYDIKELEGVKENNISYKYVYYKKK